jgi:hypothetical protein
LDVPISVSAVKGGLVTSPDWHDELELIAELSGVNHIARFVLLLLDADAGRREQVSVADEAHLAGRAAQSRGSLADNVRIWISSSSW